MALLPSLGPAVEPVARARDDFDPALGIENLSTMSMRWHSLWSEDAGGPGARYTDANQTFKNSSIGCA
jgi:hypothetical protein